MQICLQYTPNTINSKLVPNTQSIKTFNSLLQIIDFSSSHNVREGDTLQISDKYRDETIMYYVAD